MTSMFTLNEQFGGWQPPADLELVVEWASIGALLPSKVEKGKAEMKKILKEDLQKLGPRPLPNFSQEECVDFSILIIKHYVEKYMKTERMRTLISNPRDDSKKEFSQELRKTVRKVLHESFEMVDKKGNPVTVTLADLNISEVNVVKLWFIEMNLSRVLPFIGLHSHANAKGGKGLIRRKEDGSRWRQQLERKVISQRFAYNEDKLQGEVCMDFIMKQEYILNKSSNTRVKLTIPEMNFGIVTNSCNCRSPYQSSRRNQEADCCQCFIRKVAIKVSSTSWARNCRDLEPFHTTQNFNIANTRNLAVQVAAPNMAAPQFPQVNATFQASRSVTREEHADGWHSAFKDPHNPLSVEWTWQLSRFADGTELKFNKPWSANGAKELLRGNPAHMPMKPPVSASWDLLPDVELEHLLPAWDMVVRVETAVLRRTNFLGLNTSHVVNTGATIVYGGQLTL